MRFVPPLLSLLAGLWLPGTAAAGEAFHEPHAVRLVLSEADLNRILRDALHSNGGPVFEGRKERLSRSASGLSYQARVSPPSIELQPDARAALRLEIPQAELRIAHVERRLAGGKIRCEGLGAAIEPDRPLAVALELQFAVEGGDLRFVPLRVTSDGSRAFQLTKPERCRHYLLPKWLLWWLGKPHLRRQLARLDELLLEQAQRGASALEQHGGLLRQAWQFASTELRLSVRAVDTDGGALSVGLAASAGPPPPAGGDSGAPPHLEAPGSYLALAATVPNGIFDLAFADLPDRARRPRGSLRKLLDSEALLTLVPGLRQIGGTEELQIRFRFRRPPRMRFRSLPHGADLVDPSLELDPPPAGVQRAVIVIDLSGLEIEILQETPGGATVLGLLSVDSARVSVVPYRGRMGGISFEPLENEWRISSRGIEFDEPLLAATLQELVFGELFQTRFEPLAFRGLTIGKTRFEPRAFRSVGDYLIIRLGPEPPSPAPPEPDLPIARRTDSPPASR